MNGTAVRSFNFKSLEIVMTLLHYDVAYTSDNSSSESDTTYSLFNKQVTIREIHVKEYIGPKFSRLA
jgi:hypothetical protein